MQKIIIVLIIAFTTLTQALPSKIYLTIDDAPSCHMKKKIDFLYDHNIPCIFFCRGNAIVEHKEFVIEAIKKGFLIGNHSYSHPFFSQIPLEQCYQEINKTEQLINACYQEAGVTRPMKVIRLPYGDRGAGDFARRPETMQEKMKVAEIQDFLAKQEFTQIVFEDFSDTALDVFWTWDSQDYKKKFIENSSEYMDNFKQYYYDSMRATEILLLHDFDNNHHLFELGMEFLLQNNLQFLSS